MTETDNEIANKFAKRIQWTPDLVDTLEHEFIA